MQLGEYGCIVVDPLGKLIVVSCYLLKCEQIITIYYYMYLLIKQNSKGIFRGVRIIVRLTR